jgi:hypothetical protein
MRVLLVAPFNSRKFRSRRFDFFGRRLANGFIRNGHFVVNFSDRDSVKTALGIRSLGARLAGHRLLEMAEHIRPDLLCLHTFDLISINTVRRVKQKLPGCRVAVVYCDTLLDPAKARLFRQSLEAADFGFATTAGRSLAGTAKRCPVAFIPNLVDTSIDNAGAFAHQDKTSDVFCCCGNTGPADRWRLIDELRRQRPGLRYVLHGRDKRNQISGEIYFKAMQTTKIGLNVNQLEGDLYSSDRMAQYLGNGLLLASYRRSGFSRCFDDGEMIFFDDVVELGEKIERAACDDVLWRSMAERGHRKAVALMSGLRVTDFIMRMTFEEGPPKDWQFCDQIYASTSRI